MTSETRLLRYSLALMLLLLVLGCGLLYLFSAEASRDWPSLAHLRMPAYLAVLVGLVPVVVVIISMFEFLRTVDQGEEFSSRTLRLLRRVRLLAVAFGVYAAVGLVGFWLVSGMMHLTLIFAWFVIEAMALFVFALATLFGRIFATARDLDKERRADRRAAVDNR